jgi:hypothetical protein
MALSQYDPEYVVNRAHALKRAFGDRNARMDDYERMYRMDVWKDARKPGEVRVSLPVAHDVVEKLRAMMLTRPPVVTVPTVSARIEDQQRAQKVERYLYGASSRTNLHKLVSHAGWYALTFGVGILKVHYDSFATEDDFPLVVTAPDPRSMFWRMDPKQERMVEAVQMWKRSRREIEQEWDFTLPRVNMLGDTLDAESTWLDGEVTYIEYWAETTVWEDVEREEDKPEPKLLTDLVGEAMQMRLQGMQAPSVDMPYGPMADEPGEMQPMADGSGMLEPAEGTGADKKEDAAEVKPRTRVRRRKIIHAVVVEDAGGDTPAGVMVKRAVYMPGYRQIPFVKFAGISTPLPADGGDISILYPLANGSGGDRAMGVLASMNLLASIDLESAIKAPNAPVYTDDPDAMLDMGQGAINYVKPGSKIDRIRPDTSNPAVQRSYDLLDRHVSGVGVPDVYRGKMEQLSGQAISGFATAFQMALGFRQKEVEQALERLYEIMLCLTAKFADPETGWTAWGANSYGRHVEVTVKPADIGSNYRVQVKLSASMPKDTVGLASMLSMLQSKGQLSLESFIDQLQKLPEVGLAAESPDDEIVRIYRDKLLGAPQFAEVIAKALGMDVVGMLEGAGAITPEAVQAAEQMLYPPPQQQQPMLPAGPGGPGPMGPGGPGGPGMPPGMPPGMMGPGGPMMPGGGGPPGPPMPGAPAMPMPQPGIPPGFPPGVVPPMYESAG